MTIRLCVLSAVATAFVSVLLAASFATQQTNTVLDDISKNLSERYTDVRKNCALLLAPNRGYRLDVNDTVCLELKQNPTTGYNWYYAVTPKSALRLELDRTFLPEKDERVGAPSVRLLKFRAVRKGFVTIICRYYRVWEGEKKTREIQKFALNVR